MPPLNRHVIKDACWNLFSSIWTQIDRAPLFLAVAAEIGLRGPSAFSVRSHLSYYFSLLSSAQTRWTAHELPGLLKPKTELSFARTTPKQRQ